MVLKDRTSWCTREVLLTRSVLNRHAWHNFEPLFLVSSRHARYSLAMVCVTLVTGVAAAEIVVVVFVVVVASMRSVVDVVFVNWLSHGVRSC